MISRSAYSVLLPRILTVIVCVCVLMSGVPVCAHVDEATLAAKQVADKSSAYEVHARMHEYENYHTCANLISRFMGQMVELDGEIDFSLEEAFRKSQELERFVSEHSLSAAFRLSGARAEDEYTPTQAEAVRVLAGTLESLGVSWSPEHVLFIPEDSWFNELFYNMSCSSQGACMEIEHNGERVPFIFVFEKSVNRNDLQAVVSVLAHEYIHTTAVSNGVKYVYAESPEDAQVYKFFEEGMCDYQAQAIVETMRNVYEEFDEVYSVTYDVQVHAIEQLFSVFGDAFDSCVMTLLAQGRPGPLKTLLGDMYEVYRGISGEVMKADRDLKEKVVVQSVAKMIIKESVLLLSDEEFSTYDTLYRMYMLLMVVIENYQVCASVVDSKIAFKHVELAAVKYARDIQLGQGLSSDLELRDGGVDVTVYRMLDAFFNERLRRVAGNDAEEQFFVAA